MDGQGVASTGGGPDKSGLSAITAAGFGHPAESHATNDIADGVKVGDTMGMAAT